MNWKWIVGLGAAAVVTLFLAVASASFAILSMTLMGYLPIAKQAADDFHSFNQQVAPAVETGKQINASLQEGIKTAKEFSLWKAEQELRRK